MTVMGWRVLGWDIFIQMMHPLRGACILCVTLTAGKDWMSNRFMHLMDYNQLLSHTTHGLSWQSRAIFIFSSSSTCVDICWWVMGSREARCRHKGMVCGSVRMDHWLWLMGRKNGGHLHVPVPYPRWRLLWTGSWQLWESWCLLLVGQYPLWVRWQVLVRQWPVWAGIVTVDLSHRGEVYHD